MNDQLNQFVNQKRAAGFRDDQIANELMSAGWDTASIDMALGRVQQQSAMPQQNNRKFIIGIGISMLVLVAIGISLALSGGDNTSNSISEDEVDTGTIAQAALPELQRSRRDTSRRNDVGRLVAAVETYAANNSGKYPESSEINLLFTQGYLDADEWVDPLTETSYSFTTNVSPAAGEIFYDTGYFCDGDTPSQGPLSSSRNIAVVVRLEDNSVYCQDNQ